MSVRQKRPAAVATTLPLAQRRLAADGHLLVGDGTGLRPRRPGIRWRWGRYLVAFAAVYCSWLGHQEWTTYHRLVAERAALGAQVAQLRRQQAALKSAVAYANSDAYVRSQAMQQFGMVGQGDVPLAPLPAGTSTPSH